MQAHSKICVFAVLLVIGCGGGSGGSYKGKPLKTRYDDALLVQVPGDQRAAADAARATWQKAVDENRKAEADLAEMKASMGIVKNDRKSVELRLDSAKQNKKSAEQSKDGNRINTAQNEIRIAESAKKAADARVKYYEKYKSFLEKNKKFTEEQMYWRESQYELAKSQIGQLNAIRPPKVNYAEFGPQEEDRMKRAEKARDSALSEKAKAASQREDWLRKQVEADIAGGTKTNFPDPMLQHANQNTST